ncbi:MAG: hypothetical protein J5736_01200 [Bacilli bacterium]|nr:hypothetical protein [Bacilli bacterium]
MGSDVGSLVGSDVGSEVGSLVGSDDGSVDDSDRVDDSGIVEAGSGEEVSEDVED